ncbi:endocuticle structural glycoprotein SgAbd-2 [Harpegnathos saltator]|uniref:Endocuticle structural glycoprotein SgAbd-2 n=1 Tax=Harpegnathos saltator TaxID=610380 RepID=E2BGZ6_HARSA|nr:endocuticle structural glycoprotein SgAbd-2 [Harpegnathos saltator]EFN85029.1 Endocuticle structural glycoprotein SgAbd-2 [Harpegnathos saltator]
MYTTTLALLCTLAAAAFAAPAAKQSKDEPVPILAYSFDGPNPEGSYSYSYETGNGIKAQEQGQLAKIAGDEDALRVQGSFSYVGVDGNTIGLTYVADENGFQPKGDHLPTPPPVPADILKALEYIAVHPEEDNL